MRESRSPQHVTHLNLIQTTCNSCMQFVWVLVSVVFLLYFFCHVCLFFHYLSFLSLFFHSLIIFSLLLLSHFDAFCLLSSLEFHLFSLLIISFPCPIISFLFYFLLFFSLFNISPRCSSPFTFLYYIPTFSYSSVLCSTVLYSSTLLSYTGSALSAILPSVLLCCPRLICSPISYHLLFPPCLFSPLLCSLLIS